MVNRRNKALIESFVRTFPPLRLALNIKDALCYLLCTIVTFIKRMFEWSFKLISGTLLKLLTYLGNFFPHHGRYQLIESLRLKIIPVPYGNKPVRRFLTYHLGLFLGFALYLFVYYILVKRHSPIIIAVSLILLLIYMVLLENSHNFRSILMLSLPIMFTNRGRALIYCLMIGLTVHGPVHNTHINVGKLHSSLRCCRGYLIVKADEKVERNAISNVVRLEDLMNQIIKDIEEFADAMRKKFRFLTDLILTVEEYIDAAVEEMKKIIAICNDNGNGTLDVTAQCVKSFQSAYDDCRQKLGSTGGFLCEIMAPLKDTCPALHFGATLCQIPLAVVHYIEQTIGERMKELLLRLEEEFYVKMKIHHNYTYRGSKSKNFTQVADEVEFDIEEKFWYVRIVSRVFNLLTLILVCWILGAAILYHKHYLTELPYDNMYLDHWLEWVELRRLKKQRSRRFQEESERDLIDLEGSSIKTLEAGSNENDEQQSGQNQEQENNRNDTLLPMSLRHQRKYLHPFSWHMNHEERHKLRYGAIVWLIISGFCFFFLILDFSLYELITVGDELLRDILFRADLPLVKIESRTENQIGETKVTTYNRTHFKQLRELRFSSFRFQGNTSHGNNSLSQRYRHLMEKIERSIPDEVAILDSLESCLPSASEPNLSLYKELVTLASVTMLILFIEAYALRTRHCIANLYFPLRSKERAVWFYRHLLSEKNKYKDGPTEEENDQSDESKVDNALTFALKWLATRVRR